MSDEHPVLFDPTPDDDRQPAGVRAGYLYQWSGKPGPALVADAVILIGDDGMEAIEVTSEFRDCEVVDDDDRGDA